MEQITAKAEQMGLPPQLVELISAAYEAGIYTGVAYAAMDLADDGNESGVELLTANYPIAI